MNQNLFEAQYNVTKKGKLKKFYDDNKILVYSFLILIIVLFASFSFYFDSKDKKKTLLADNYIQAKLYINNNESDKAKEVLETIVFSNDPTYSTLSLFLILNENLINQPKVIINMFDHVLENNKFEKEIKNLIIFKKILYSSSFIDEVELLNLTTPLINSESQWKSHILLLLGDYFISKKEYLKAKEFYTQVLSLKNLNAEIYELAKTKLIFIDNE